MLLEKGRGIEGGEGWGWWGAGWETAWIRRGGGAGMLARRPNRRGDIRLWAAMRVEGRHGAGPERRDVRALRSLLRL
jgi:hypothetical protein